MGRPTQGYSCSTLRVGGRFALAGLLSVGVAYPRLRSRTRFSPGCNIAGFQPWWKEVGGRLRDEADRQSFRLSLRQRTGKGERFWVCCGFAGGLGWGMDWGVNMRNWRLAWTFSFGLVLGLAVVKGRAAEEPDPKRFEKEIAEFEKLDEAKAPPKGAVLFVGSSSIRMWKSLEEDFAGTTVIGRGFGGSHMADLLHYMDRIVLPYEPAKIVVYEGDNDIAGEKKPARIAQEFQRFVKRVQEKLPRTEIYFIAIKPSPSRWHLAQPARAANALIETYAERTPRVHFVDIWTPMLGEDGKPREELFVEDKLHLNAKGYAIWTEVLKPLVTGGG